MDFPKSARLISIAGHPAVIMPVAVACATRHADPEARWTALSLVAVAVAGVMLYSVYKARSGAWAHIDASEKHERSQLNRFASLGLMAFAGMLVLTGSHPRTAAAVGLSGALVLAGHLLKGRWKPSLHVAFAAFAAGIVWPDAVAVAALLAATALVAWSRLVLCRHSTSDVVVGAVLGLACGFAFQAVAAMPLT